MVDDILKAIQGEWDSWMAGVHPAVGKVAGEGMVVLHGSLTRGVVDEVADYDLWVLAPEEAVAQYDRARDSRFVKLPDVRGREGHLTVESIEEMSGRIDRCEVAWIDELRLCRVVRQGRGEALAKRCQRPMRDAVRRGLFEYHYLEFRSEDRALDNPIRRRDGVAMLIAAADALEHAMRAGLVLEGRTYPYKKWLARAFRECAIGERCWPLVEELLGALTPAGYGRGGPEREHAASNALRGIRGVLTEEAEKRGLSGRYLREWWLEMTRVRSERNTLRWE